MGPNMASLDQGLTDASTAKLWLRGNVLGSSNRGGVIPSRTQRPEGGREGGRRLAGADLQFGRCRAVPISD